MNQNMLQISRRKSPPISPISWSAITGAAIRGSSVESCFCVAMVEGKLPQFRKPKKRFLLAGAPLKRGLLVRSANRVMTGRCFLICGLVAVAALAHAQQFGRMSSMKESKIGLVVHGGAGTMERGKMSPEREREYRAGIENALRAGWEILQHGGSRLEGTATGGRAS